MSCMDRRDFIKLIGYTMFMSTIPTSIREKAFAGSLNPIEWVNLINKNCVSCKVDLTGCVRVDAKGVHVAPKISYWVPEAFIDSTRSFEFTRTLPFGSYLSSVIRPFIDALTPFVPSGTYSIVNTEQGQNYMKLYPHYFGFPPPVIPYVRNAILALKLDPVCIACNLADSIISALIPVNNVREQIEKNLPDIYRRIEDLKKSFSGSLDKITGGKFSEIKSFNDKLNSIMSSYSSIGNLVPFLPSELFFFIWSIDTFSPDAYTLAPLFNSVIQLVQSASLPIGALTCPTLTQHLNKIQLPAGIDPSFICVGRWGFGYPRTGIVRHDDPMIASLLSIARFHHLFSKTIPLITPSFSFSDIKYQLYYPEKTDCFKPGYFSSDPIAKSLFSIETSGQSILDVIQNPSENLKQTINSIKDKIKDSVKNSGFSLIYKDRPVGVVVWKYHTKCCW